MQSVEFVEELRDSHNEVFGKRADVGRIILSYRLGLEHVCGINNITVLLDKRDLALQELNVLIDKFDHERSAIEIRIVALVHLLNLNPTLMLSIEKFLVGHRINPRTVQHLPVDENHGLESDYDQIKVQLVD